MSSVVAVPAPRENVLGAWKIIKAVPGARIAAPIRISLRTAFFGSLNSKESWPDPPDLGVDSADRDAGGA
jgi:hypothetical protein